MKKNAGFVLVSGMVFLLIITIIVIYLLRTSILEEKMVANSIDRQRALQAADAVLREAENVIMGVGLPNPKLNSPFDPFILAAFSSTCVRGLCSNQVETVSPWTISWSTLANLKTSTLTFDKVATPNYVIDLIEQPRPLGVGLCSDAVYKIVVKGVGKIGAESLVQSYFRQQVNKCDKVY